jgi:hypothetical protein
MTQPTALLLSPPVALRLRHRYPRAAEALDACAIALASAHGGASFSAPGRRSKVAHFSFLNNVSKSFFSIVTIIKFAALAAVAKLVDALL